jgi:telomerase reverse transcriptase
VYPSDRKMGKQFYRQKVGIPQGSVLSTILCNIFYADLEKKKLPFLMDDDGLLLRLIDDFLFISMNREHAKSFLEHMHQGSFSYLLVSRKAFLSMAVL